MSEKKFGDYFVTELKQNIPGTKWHPKVEPAEKGKGGRILFMDSEMIPGACYTEAVWIRSGNSEVQRRGGIQAHTHDFDEVLGFFGTNPEDPYDLGAEIEFWLDEEKHVLSKTCLIFIPRGLRHCPLKVLGVNTPVFHFSSHGDKMYTGKDGGEQKQEIKSSGKPSSEVGMKFGKYIVTELNKNIVEAPWSPSLQQVSKGQTGRVLWLDNETVPGAFYVETVWIYPREETPEKRGAQTHTHDYDEVLAFFSGNPDDPHHLGAEAEFWIEDEKYTITKSCLVFVPKGIKHAPLYFNRVDRPVFHFTLGHGKMYF